MIDKKSSVIWGASVAFSYFHSKKGLKSQKKVIKYYQRNRSLKRLKKYKSKTHNFLYLKGKKTFDNIKDKVNPDHL